MPLALEALSIPDARAEEELARVRDGFVRAPTKPEVFAGVIDVD